MSKLSPEIHALIVGQMKTNLAISKLVETIASRIVCERAPTPKRSVRMRRDDHGLLCGEVLSDGRAVQSFATYRDESGSLCVDVEDL